MTYISLMDCVMMYVTVYNFYLFHDTGTFDQHLPPTSPICSWFNNLTNLGSLAFHGSEIIHNFWLDCEVSKFLTTTTSFTRAFLRALLFPWIRIWYVRAVTDLRVLQGDFLWISSTNWMWHGGVQGQNWLSSDEIALIICSSKITKNQADWVY